MSLSSRALRLESPGRVRRYSCRRSGTSERWPTWPQATTATVEQTSQAARLLAEATGGPCPAPTATAVTSWASDRSSGGAYTHIPPGSSPADVDLLGEPLDGQLLFAGEHTQSARMAYADGALTSGIREAKRLLRQPSVKLGPLAEPGA